MLKCSRDFIFLRHKMNLKIFNRNRMSLIVLCYLLFERDCQSNYIITSVHLLASKLMSDEIVIKSALDKLQRNGFIAVYKQPNKQILIAVRENEDFYLIDGNQTYLDESLKTNFRQSRNIKGYGKFRKNVLERDNFTCQICSSKVDLEVHHIKEYSKYPNLRTCLSNGITLCKSCHKKIHSSGEHNNDNRLDKVVSQLA